MAITLDDILDTDSLNSGKTKINNNNATITGAIGAASGIAELDASGYVLDSSSRRVVDSGSNSNGNYVMYADGTQYCWFNADVTYANASVLTYTWTFPSAFATTTIDPSISGFINMASYNWAAQGVGNPYAYISTLSRTAVSGTNVLLALYRSNNGSSFASGDYWNVDMVAIGRWY